MCNKLTKEYLDFYLKEIKDSENISFKEYIDNLLKDGYFDLAEYNKINFWLANLLIDFYNTGSYHV